MCPNDTCSIFYVSQSGSFDVSLAFSDSFRGCFLILYCGKDCSLWISSLSLFSLNSYMLGMYLQNINLYSPTNEIIFMFFSSEKKNDKT
jgi:hypothetical protein